MDRGKIMRLDWYELGRRHGRDLVMRLHDSLGWVLDLRLTHRKGSWDRILLLWQAYSIDWREKGEGGRIAYTYSLSSGLDKLCNHTCIYIVLYSNPEQIHL